jgi:hypothetical protein
VRLWSISPEYLDAAGLVALWREGLLAQKVLLGQTKGYKSHPQLHRFRACSDPVASIGWYLHQIVREADSRGYRFDASKIVQNNACRKIEVTEGQVDYEWQHLLTKLQNRSPAIYVKHHSLVMPKTHPLFVVVAGDVEDWEKV